jgi:hypothetical protein
MDTLWRLKPPYLGAFAITLFVLTMPLCLRHASDWDTVYFPAARHLRAGEVIFQDGFVYPPVNALLALPALNLPRMAGVICWYVVSAAALLWLIHSAWQLSRDAGSDPRFDRRTLLAGLVCGLPFAFDCLSNRQSDLLVAALMMTGCLALRSGRSLLSGVWFGLAAGLKCTPLLWAPYLALRRRFNAAILVGVVAVGVNLIPDAVYPSPTGSRLVQWSRAFLAPVATGDREVGVWASAPINNHSLAGVAFRLLTLERAAVDGHKLARIRASAVSPQTLRLVTYGLDAALLLAAAVAMWRRRDHSTPAIDSSVVVLLMLLLSPQSSKPHFCTLILPGFCLARMAFERRDTALKTVLALAAVGALLANKDIWGTTIYEAVMWYSSLFLATLLLFAGCLRAGALRVSRAKNQVAGEIRPSQGLDAVA